MRTSVGKRAARDRAKWCYANRATGIPVNVVAVAESFGITVVQHPLSDEVSGMLILKNKKPVIVVNDDHALTRQRFSIAHELAHYLLHFEGEDEVFHRDERSSQGISRIEIEANAFAAELLMPEEELAKLVNGSALDVFDDTKVSELIERLKVSVQALSIRLEQLGYIRPEKLW